MGSQLNNTCSCGQISFILSSILQVDVLIFLSCLSCPDCLCPCCLVMAVLFLSSLSFHHHPILAALSWLSLHGCLFLAVLSLLYFPGCPFLMDTIFSAESSSSAIKVLTKMVRLLKNVSAQDRG